ncbi:transferase CAF17 mitochondrial [Apiospora arundinis]
MQALPRRAGARSATTAATALRRSIVRPETRSSSPFVCSSCLATPTRTFSSSQRCNNDSTTKTHSPPAPSSPPPSSGYAALPSRRVISVSGVDAAKFLQGMVTSNMTDLTTTARRPLPAGFYTGFLQSTGRVLYDVFIYPDTLGLGDGAAEPTGTPDAPRPTESFLIECDDAQTGAVMRHIKKYKLRSKFKFRALEPEECMVWQVWNDATFAAQNGSSEAGAEEGQKNAANLLLPDQQGKIILRDPRSPTMGLRVLGPAGTSGAALPSVQAEQSSADAYRIRRYLDGVAEGAAEIQRDAALPLEANMDVMGGIDFRKGCYLGQELTIRTKHRGVVRKRILPAILYGENDAAPETLEYKPSVTTTTGTGEGEGGLSLSAADVPNYVSIGRTGGRKGRSAGVFLDGVGNIGLGLCRLQMMTDVQLPGEAAEAAPFDPSKEFLMQWGGGEEEGSPAAQKLKIKAFVPEWLRSKLNEGNGELLTHEGGHGHCSSTTL